MDTNTQITEHLGKIMSIYNKQQATFKQHLRLSTPRLKLKKCVAYKKVVCLSLLSSC